MMLDWCLALRLSDLVHRMLSRPRRKPGFHCEGHRSRPPISRQTGWYHCEQLSHMIPVSVTSNPHALHGAESDLTEDMMKNHP